MSVLIECDYLGNLLYESFVTKPRVSPHIKFFLTQHEVLGKFSGPALILRLGYEPKKLKSVDKSRKMTCTTAHLADMILFRKSWLIPLIRCFLQIVEISHKQVQKTEQLETIRSQAVRHDQETKIPTIETISKIQNTYSISETTKNHIDSSVVVSKQAAIISPKQNETKLDNPASATIISGSQVDPNLPQTCPN